jgi:AcrR family transcriptional regulator
MRYNQAMAMVSKKSAANTDRAAAGNDKRQVIADALDACIRKRGIAATSLTDIAEASGMSPSHIRYYFESKEDIIEFYLEQLAAEILAAINRIERRSPEQWLKEFAAYFVGSPRLTRTSVGVVMEVFGVSVHSPRLTRIKTRYDTAIRKIFLDFFKWSGVAEGITAADAAYLGWALETGLKFTAVFQPHFSRKKAEALFLAEMYRLTGLVQRPASLRPPSQAD